MLRMFVDDSGIGQEPVYCLAGFVASAKTWANFSDDWRNALDAEPAVANFKGVEWNGLRGAFGGWDRESADQKKRKLNELVMRHSLLGYACLIKHDDYVLVFGEGSEARKETPPYLILFNHLVSQISDYLTLRGNNDPIEFVFDTQEGHDRTVLSGWFEFLGNTFPHIRALISGTPVFRSEQDPDFVALQAADMLAWQFRREYYCLKNGKPAPQNIYAAATSDTIALVIDQIHPVNLVNASLMNFYAKAVTMGIYSIDLLHKISIPLGFFAPRTWTGPVPRSAHLPRWE